MDFLDFPLGEGFDNNVNTLFSRRCKTDCPPLKPCNCKSGQVCTQSQYICTRCAERKCVDASKSGITINHPSSGGGTNIGAVVGGVIGGLIFIAILVWLVWRFVIKPRQQAWGLDYDEPYEPYSERDTSAAYGGSPEQQRNSQFTRRSVASTTYTRGSNVIQIAFIPGITERSGDDDPFVPPVPPIPIRTATSTPQSPQSPYTDAPEEHYFMPGDLRDSHYSGFTDDGASTFNRQSTAASIAPSLLRQSVASNVNRASQVENPAPAQTAQRGRPLVVSVKSGQNSRSNTPSVPRVDYEKYSQPRPIKPSSPTPLLNETASVTSFKTAGDASSSNVPAIKVDTASVTSRQQTPPQLIKSDDDKAKADLLKSQIEEATRQASRQPVHGGLGSVHRDPSPFSDANRLEDESP